MRHPRFRPVALPVVTSSVFLAATLLAAAVCAAAEDAVLTGVQKEALVTLQADKSYTLSGEYRVPADTELRIEAGAAIHAAEDAALVVEGTLRATADRFNIAQFYGPPGKTWKGIRLVNPQGVRLERAHVADAEIGVHFKDARGCLLIDCFLPVNGIGVLADGKTEARLENCSITRSTTSAVVVSGGYLEVDSCSLVSSSDWGLECTGPGRVAFWSSIATQNGKGGIRIANGCRFRARNSSVSHNRNHDIVNDDTTNKDFARNWWDGLTWSLIQQGTAMNVPTILDGHDDPSKGCIWLDDFLRAKPEHCGVSSSTRHTDTESPIIGPHEARITKGARVVFTETAYGVPTAAHFESVDAARLKGDKTEIAAYLRAGAAFEIDKGALAVTVAAAGPAYGVRILGGKHAGKQGWVFKDAVALSCDLSRVSLVGKRFFWRRHGMHSGMVLTVGQGGRIEGGEMMESFWKINDKGQLVFYDRNREVSTVFDRAEVRRGRLFLAGERRPSKYRPMENLTFYLEETPAPNSSAAD